MNILIFDPWKEGRMSARTLLRDRFENVVCVGSLPELLAPNLLTSPTRFAKALFVVPSIFIGKGGEVRARSNRTSDILEVTITCSFLGIPHALFSTSRKGFPAYIDFATDKEVPLEIAFWRKMDRSTGTFEGCYLGRDWNAMLETAEEFLERDMCVSL